MKKNWIPVFLLIILLLTGCSSPKQPAVTDANEADTMESGPDVDSVQVDSEGEDTNSTDDTNENKNTPVPPSAADSSVPEIIHWEFPNKFQLTPLQSIFDCKTAPYFVNGQVYELSEVCDQWDRNYFERPLDESLGELFPQLDIIQADFGQDEKWYYTQIRVFAEMVENLVLDGIYALEIDLDLDAKGDILIIAAAPGTYPPDEWQSKGVQVWLDSNDDVGGPTAVMVDPRYDGDGYETLLVSSGQGDDPDLAFVKTSTEEPGLVEFGFKTSLLGEVKIFEWWVWAMREDLGAAKYDPVDFFPQDTLYAMDNTCGWIYGSYQRDLPNICDTIMAPKDPKQKPTGNSSETCKPGTPAIVDNCYKWDQSTCSWYWDGSCFN